MSDKIIAIDFDDTITNFSPYPITGSVRPEAVYYIKLLVKQGYKLILWTCREGKYLEEALNILKINNILSCFSTINCNIVNSNSSKVIADFYIDDKSMFEEINWQDVYNYIIQNIK